MLSKTWGAASLAAGTSIGAGALALPQLVASIGPLAAIGLFFSSWVVVYYLCLCTAGLHIAAGGKHTFIAICKRFGGSIAGIISSVSFVCLGYALLAAYSVALVDVFLSCLFCVNKWIVLFAGVFLLALPISVVEKINRPFLVLVVVLFVVFCGGLLSNADIGRAFSYTPTKSTFLLAALPAIFTSFGCQIVISSVVDYCDLDRVAIRRALFYGTLIPLIIYTVWVVSAIGVLCKGGSDFWHMLRLNQAKNVACVMESIGQMTGGVWSSLVPFLSFLALFTSFVGVGVSLVDSVQNNMVYALRWFGSNNRFFASVLVVVPTWCLAFFSQAVFVSFLSFAGAINAIIAVFLPLWMLKNAHMKEDLCSARFVPPGWKVISLCVAIIVVVSEIFYT